MISENIVQFDDVLALAYRLTPLEKIKLIKWMAEALEHELKLTSDTSVATIQPNEEHWSNNNANSKTDSVASLGIK